MLKMMRCEKSSLVSMLLAYRMDFSTCGFRVCSNHFANVLVLRRLTGFVAMQFLYLLSGIANAINFYLQAIFLHLQKRVSAFHLRKREKENDLSQHCYVTGSLATIEPSDCVSSHRLSMPIRTKKKSLDFFL